MPDQSSAADEHAILAEITAPLANLPDDAVPIAADVDFPVVLRGYDRLAVDAYVHRTSQLVAELQATRSPEAAVRRALERVGEQVAGLLQRAHETSGQITAQSRREAEDRLDVARHEALQITAAAEQRLKDLDVDTDRIWSERMRIVEDARQLARDLMALADSAAEQFPAAQDGGTDEVQPISPAPGTITDFAAIEETEVLFEPEPEPAPATPQELDPDVDPDATAAFAPIEPHEPDEPLGPDEPDEHRPGPGDPAPGP
jgi:cell division septum initiation protein DivIVA